MPSIVRKNKQSKKDRVSSNKGMSRNRKSRSSSSRNKQESSILPINEKKLNECLVWFIRTKYSLCNNGGEEESIAIVEAISESFLEIINTSSSSSTSDGMNHSLYESAKEYLSQFLLEYLSPDLSDEQAKEITHVALEFMCGHIEHYKDHLTSFQRRENNESDSSSDDDDDDDDDNDNNYNEEDHNDFDHDENDFSDSDDEENYIQEGECELCERQVKLTRHHLIPRSTWPRIRPRFLKASQYLKEGNMEKAEKILNIGSPIPPSLTANHCSSGSRVKQFLSCYTCDICSMCHKTVHNTFDNLELAEERNTVEKLLEDETIFKFCKWASKQRSRSKRSYKR